MARKKATGSRKTIKVVADLSFSQDDLVTSFRRRWNSTRIRSAHIKKGDVLALALKVLKGLGVLSSADVGHFRSLHEFEDSVISRLTLSDDPHRERREDNGA